MTDMAVQYLALIQAVVARVEGMKAENQACKKVGNTPCYGEQHFLAEARQLEEYANQIRDQRTA